MQISLLILESSHIQLRFHSNLNLKLPAGFGHAKNVELEIQNSLGSYYIKPTYIQQALGIQREKKYASENQVKCGGSDDSRRHK